MNSNFVMRAGERGYNQFLSTGESSSYIGCHPNAIVTRHSSFNFGPYQSGRRNFGRIRVFGAETFSRTGCGYNIIHTTTSSSAHLCCRGNSPMSIRWETLTN
jgi:hypothetical protein